MSTRRRAGARAGEVDPMAVRMAMEAERLAALDAADAAERAAHADDLAWVTAERDALLAAVKAIAEALADTHGPERDPAERALVVARTQRGIIEAGREAVRRG